MAIKFDGPIPGQSLTREPGNSGWEQPPQLTDVDEALTVLFKKLTSEKMVPKLLNMMQMGMPITSIVEGTLMAGFAEGKWTPDMALLMAKPVSMMLMRIAKEAEIQPVFGAEEEEDPSFLELAKQMSGAPAAPMQNEQTGPTGSFMDM